MNNASAAVDPQETKNDNAKHGGCNGKTPTQMPIQMPACNEYGINRVAGLTGSNRESDAMEQPDGQHHHANRINGHDRADLLQMIAAGPKAYGSFQKESRHQRTC
jgi:hypothetical protein